VAKIQFAQSVLCLELSGKELNTATQVPDSFRDYLHMKKFEAFSRMKGIDTTNPASSPLQIAASLAELAVYDDLLIFIASKNDPDLDPA
jgi:hypothetical protein